MTQPFGVAVSVTLDSTGAGTAVISPRGNVDWVSSQRSVFVAPVAPATSSFKIPTAMVYRDAAGPANFLEGSYTGNNDASDTSFLVRAGGSLICVWAGGDAGALATFRAAGTQYPFGQAPAV